MQKTANNVQCIEVIVLSPSSERTAKEKPSPSLLGTSKPRFFLVHLSTFQMPDRQDLPRTWTRESSFPRPKATGSPQKHDFLWLLLLLTDIITIVTQLYTTPQLHCSVAQASRFFFWKLDTLVEVNRKFPFSNHCFHSLYSSLSQLSIITLPLAAQPTT